MTPDPNPSKPTRKLVYGLLTVGVLLVLVAGAAAGRERFARARHRIHLNAAIPKICEELCSQRQVLLKAIEAYKARLGAYPPDHLISKEPLVVDAVTNQLLYELLGTYHDPAADIFIANRFTPIPHELVRSYFNTEAFKNSASKMEEVQHFLDPGDVEATVAVHDKPAVGVLGYFPGWEGIQPDIYAQVDLGSWRYNTSAPVHNPGRYDLWIEIKTTQTNIVIGNW